MARDLNALSDDHATGRNGNPASESSKEGKRKRRGGPKVKSGCLTCKYGVPCPVQTTKLTLAEFGE